MATVVESPMHGMIDKVLVKVGDRVRQGDTLCLLEAMKMVTPLEAPVDGTVVEICVAESQSVARGAKLIVLE